jgi:hypothetical protein
VLDVGDQGQLLDERPVARLGLAQIVLELPRGAEIADEGGKRGRAVQLEAADADLHRELVPVRMQGRQLEAPADQVALPAGGRGAEAASMRVPKPRRHDQVGQLATEDGVRRVAEEALGGPVELAHATLRVDDDHGVERRVQQRPHLDGAAREAGVSGRS